MGKRVRQIGRIRHKKSRVMRVSSEKVGGGRIKRPIILAAVEPKGHSMHKNSGIILYWLVLLALVILNVMVALVIPVLQISVSTQKLLLIVVALGFFFGYVTNKLFNLIDNLEVGHHFFARLLVPAAAMLNIFIISIATNSAVAFLGFGNKHNPVFVSLAYGAAFIIPSLASAAAAAASYLSSKRVPRG